MGLNKCICVHMHYAVKAWRFRMSVSVWAELLTHADRLQILRLIIMLVMTVHQAQVETLQIRSTIVHVSLLWSLKN